MLGSTTFITLLMGIILTTLHTTQANKSVQELWAPLLRVNKKCPRFVTMVATTDGFGDQLERLFVSLTLAWRHRDEGVTLVIPKEFGMESIHKHSYYPIFLNVLGLPANIPRLEHVMGRYKPMVRNIIGNYGDYMDKRRSFITDTPCNTITIVDIYDACKGSWCPIIHLDSIWKGMGELLPLTYQLNGNYCSTKAPAKYETLRKIISSKNVSNHANGAAVVVNVVVVWHLRHFDHTVDRNVGVTHNCRSCAPGYVDGVSGFITEAIAAAMDEGGGQGLQVLVERSDTVVQRGWGHEKDAEQERELLKLKPASFVTGDNLEEVICTFALADLLVTTGSSMPALLAYFLPNKQPVILEERRIIADSHLLTGYTGGTAFPHPYAIPSNHSFHLANGKPADGTSARGVGKALLEPLLHKIRGAGL